MSLRHRRRRETDTPGEIHTTAVGAKAIFKRMTVRECCQRGARSVNRFDRARRFHGEVARCQRRSAAEHRMARAKPYTPASGSIRCAPRRLNLEGDGQGELVGHGGEQRAVMAYQIDAYRYWERTLGRSDFTFGQFSEKFTVEGLAGSTFLHTEVKSGDVLPVSAPRGSFTLQPC